jgi:hypothetical protein
VRSNEMQCKHLWDYSLHIGMCFISSPSRSTGLLVRDIRRGAVSYDDRHTLINQGLVLFTKARRKLECSSEAKYAEQTRIDLSFVLCLRKGDENQDLACVPVGQCECSPWAVHSRIGCSRQDRELSLLGRPSICGYRRASSSNSTAHHESLVLMSSHSSDLCELE